MAIATLNGCFLFSGVRAQLKIAAETVQQGLDETALAEAAVVPPRPRKRRRTGPTYRNTCDDKFDARYR